MNDTMNIQQRIWLFTQTFEGVEKKRKAEAGKIKYSYFTIDDIYDAAVPVMSDCGIGIASRITTVTRSDHPDSCYLITELFCVDKPIDRIISEVPLDASGDPRKFGSDLTYKRRYSTVTMLNIRVPGDDDDGLSAELARKREENGSISTRMVEKIETLISGTDTERDDVISYIGQNFGVEDFAELSANQGNSLMRLLERKSKKGAN